MNNITKRLLVLSTLTIATLSGLTAYASTDATSLISEKTSKNSSITADDKDFNKDSWKGPGGPNKGGKVKLLDSLPEDIKLQIQEFHKQEKAEIDALIKSFSLDGEGKKKFKELSVGQKESLNQVREKYKTLLLDVVKDYPELVKQLNSIEIKHQVKKYKSDIFSALPDDIKKKVKDLKKEEKTKKHDLLIEFNVKKGITLTDEQKTKLSDLRKEYQLKLVELVKDYPEVVTSLEEKFSKKKKGV